MNLESAMTLQDEEMEGLQRTLNDNFITTQKRF
jgi:hypothetical protein